ALMHRDYHPLAQGTQVRVELYPDKLVFINPGGLYGAASPQDLLTGRTSSSRNAILARLLEDVEIPGTNRTVCENRGSGIRLVNAELAANGLQPPIFRPSVSVFVAELQSARVGDKQPTNSEHAGASLVNDVDSRILSALSTGPKANQELQIIIGLGRPAISRRLQKLEEQGLIAPTTNRRSRNVKWQSTT
ncbi:MAG: ArsR family transcriptional regulator, partial [Coriobacteriia bacterium]|nr:ArsR family transcriptional regulator [Coriobacteriia bacterium]